MTEHQAPKREANDITILVVDDEESLRKAVVFDFKRKGYNVLDAKNGRDAFNIIKANRIDVVLSDIRMPGGDGVELLDNIKALNPELPVVIFLTGFADLSIEDAYAKGADAVFSKPFDRKTLFEAVKKATSPRDEIWGKRAFDRLNTNFATELNFHELNLTAPGRTLNFGRGGFFVSLREGWLPSVDEKVSFSISVATPEPCLIEGNGIIRWVRNQSLNDKPAGCGVEFTYLSDSSLSQVIQLINRLKTTPFIPNS